MLTPNGQATLAAIQEAQLIWANDVGGKLEVAELRQASAVLDRLLSVLSAARDAELSGP